MIITALLAAHKRDQTSPDARYWPPGGVALMPHPLPPGTIVDPLRLVTSGPYQTIPFRNPP